jgi:hypothetical protein
LIGNNSGIKVIGNRRMYDLSILNLEGYYDVLETDEQRKIKLLNNHKSLSDIYNKHFYSEIIHKGKYQYLDVINAGFTFIIDGISIIKKNGITYLTYKDFYIWDMFPIKTIYDYNQISHAYSSLTAHFAGNSYVADDKDASFWIKTTLAARGVKKILPFKTRYLIV